MAVPRFSTLLSKFPASPFHRLVRFSSSLTPKANPISSSLYCGDSEYAGSLVYTHKLQFQRPTTIKRSWREYWPDKSVSFIGSVVFPVKPVRPVRSSDDYGVFTKLQVESSRDSKDSFSRPHSDGIKAWMLLYCFFLILLMMWGEMAEISSKYLKENDFIYVSGNLGSYTKADEDGHPKVYYKVHVKELNYVTRKGESQNNQRSEAKEGAISTSGTRDVEKKLDRLYLWQVFFASPHEWWDNRNQKKHERGPDFKHKDTGERLWLNPGDPPWVTRQLQIHDSRIAQRGYRDPERRSRVSMWKYDE